MGDFLTKGSEHGGLGFGTIGSSFVLAAVLVALVSFEIKTRRLPASAAGLPAKVFHWSRRPSAPPESEFRWSGIFLPTMAAGAVPPTGISPPEPRGVAPKQKNGRA